MPVRLLENRKGSVDAPVGATDAKSGLVGDLI
jgi:hypothetical protein